MAKEKWYGKKAWLINQKHGHSAMKKSLLTPPHKKKPCGKPLKDTDLNIYLIEDNIICTNSALRWRSSAPGKKRALKNWSDLVVICSGWK